MISRRQMFTLMSLSGWHYDEPIIVPCDWAAWQGKDLACGTFVSDTKGTLPRHHSRLIATPLSLCESQVALFKPDVPVSSVPWDERTGSRLADCRELATSKFVKRPLSRHHCTLVRLSSRRGGGEEEWKKKENRKKARDALAWVNSLLMRSSLSNRGLMYTSLSSFSMYNKLGDSGWDLSFFRGTRSRPTDLCRNLPALLRMAFRRSHREKRIQRSWQSVSYWLVIFESYSWSCRRFAAKEREEQFRTQIPNEWSARST